MIKAHSRRCFLLCQLNLNFPLFTYLSHFHPLYFFILKVHRDFSLNVICAIQAWFIIITWLYLSGEAGWTSGGRGRSWRGRADGCRRDERWDWSSSTSPQTALSSSPAAWRDAPQSLMEITETKFNMNQLENYAHHRRAINSFFFSSVWFIGSYVAARKLNCTWFTLKDY